MSKEIPKFEKGQIRFKKGILASNVYNYDENAYYCAICGEPLNHTKAHMLSARLSDIGTEFEAMCHRHTDELSRFPEDVQKILSR